MRLGEASMMRCTTFLERPARGGSTTSTSGRPARSSSSGSAVRRVAGEEVGVGDRVAPRARDRVRDRLLDQLDPPQLAGARRERERDRADPRVQVVHALPALQRGVLADHAVEQLGHLGVRLEERLRRRSAGRARPAARAAPPRPTPAPSRRPRSSRRGCASASTGRRRQALAERLAERRRERARLELALGGHDPHLQLAGAPAFAHDQVAQARAPVGAGPVRASRPGSPSPPAPRPRRGRADRRVALPRGQPLRAAPAQRDLAREVAALGGQQAVLDRDRRWLPPAGA